MDAWTGRVSIMNDVVYPPLPHFLYPDHHLCYVSVQPAYVARPSPKQRPALLRPRKV